MPDMPDTPTLPSPRPNIYAAATLDRRADLRRAPTVLADRLGDALSLPLRDLAVPVRAGAQGPELAWLPGREAGVEGILLGESGGVLHLAHSVPADRPPPPGAEFVDLRRVGALLSATDAALAAFARALLWWHGRTGFCGVCGAPTLSREAGHVRLCSGCGASHFPRTDAAVIVLVHDGDRVLLGRQRQWPQGMYSVLAGFVEPGESLEQTVAREVMEESGIAVTDIRYQSSQPWPFPQSLMLGFTARALTDAVAFDAEELEDCRWYTRQELLAVPADAVAGDAPFALPRPDSIARRLVDKWLHGTAG